MNIAEIIEQRRKQLGLSLRELSVRTGVSHTYIREVENGKYAPSFDNAYKLSKELDLDLKQIIIETYQAQFRQTLIQLIETCHKFGVSIPYDQWVRTSLPILPLNLEKTKIHDAAFEIASLMYQEQREHVLDQKLTLLKLIAGGSDDKIVYDTLPEIIETIAISLKAKGVHNTNEHINEFLHDLKTAALRNSKGDE